MLRAISLRESWMREIRTSGLTRERAPTGPSLLYTSLVRLGRNVPEGRCDRSLARSAWDSATPKEPSRRVRCDSRRFGHRFDDWSDEISNSKSTSCQATIGVVPTGRAGRHFATASTGYHKLALSASSSVAGARPLCRLNAKRQISAHNAGNAIPTAAADFGSKLRAVIPGNVFASRHQNFPASSILKSARL